MNPEQLQAFRMMRDGISESQKKVMVRLLQALIDVYGDEEGRRIVFHQIVVLMSNQEPIVLLDFMHVLRGLSPQAIAKAMNLLRDGFLSRIHLINEDNAVDDEDIDEEVNMINNEERIENDIELISETSTVKTFNISPFSKESFNPDHIFDEEISNA
jgi:hypothetical protein